MSPDQLMALAERVRAAKQNADAAMWRYREADSLKEDAYQSSCKAAEAFNTARVEFWQAVLEEQDAK